MNVYIVEGYSDESSWVSKVFDNEKSADKYAEYMNLTNRFEYQFGYNEYNVESSFDLDINENEFYFDTCFWKEDNSFEIYYSYNREDSEAIEETDGSYYITVKIKYNEYKDEDERDKIIEERAKKMLEDYLNEKN